jgi:hypothetical protein
MKSNPHMPESPFGEQLFRWRLTFQHFQSTAPRSRARRRCTCAALQNGGSPVPYPSSRRWCWLLHVRARKPAQLPPDDDAATGQSRVLSWFTKRSLEGSCSERRRLQLPKGTLRLAGGADHATRHRLPKCHRPSSTLGRPTRTTHSLISSCVFMTAVCGTRIPSSRASP